MVNMEAWHFIKPDKKLRFEPFSDIIVGETLGVDASKLELCNFGLHASILPIAALSFIDWKDAIICRVELSGEIRTSRDKLCASSRKVLWMAPADATLHEFACRCAEDILHFFEDEFPDDKRPRLAIEAKRKFLRGEISEQESDAARAAAWDAARAAAWAADWDADWDAAYKKYNSMLHDMLMALKPESV